MAEVLQDNFPISILSMEKKVTANIFDNFFTNSKAGNDKSNLGYELRYHHLVAASVLRLNKILSRFAQNCRTPHKWLLLKSLIKIYLAQEFQIRLAEGHEHEGGFLEVVQCQI